MEYPDGYTMHIQARKLRAKKIAKSASWLGRQIAKAMTWFADRSIESGGRALRAIGGAIGRSSANAAPRQESRCL